MVPGLVDLHMHFRQQRGDDFSMFRDSDAAAAIRGVEKLGLYLDGGITAVRDLGGPSDVAQKIQEAVARHIFPGPRVFWAGRLISSRGGHGDEITETASGRPKPLETSSSQRVATGPWDWRLAVREEIRRGVDVIKLTAPYDKEEVAAAIDEAHMLGLPVTVDAFGDYVTWATQAGIDCIEHPLAISPDTIKLMADKEVGAVLVVDAQQMVGIVSERDYARKVILQGRSSKDTAVQEIMTTPVVFVTRQHTVDECMAIMTDHHFRHLPVVKDGDVVGVISIGDLVKWIMSGQAQVIQELEGYIAGRYPG